MSFSQIKFILSNFVSEYIYGMLVNRYVYRSLKFQRSRGTINPRINPRGLISKTKFWVGLIRGEGLFEGGLFQLLVFPSNVHATKRHKFAQSIKVKNYTKAIFY